MSDLYQRETKCISNMAQLRFFPQAVIGGKGSYLTGDDGRRLLDFSASWGAASLGHAHPHVRDAVARVLTDQAGASYLSSANEPSVLLAEKLLSIAPGRARGRVWLGHSGSDANETVARMVVAATGRRRILAFQGAYHGGTVGSMAVSGHPALQAGARSSGLILVPYPNSYATGKPAIASAAALASLKEVFSKDVRPEEVAAFFIEPLQGDGGLLVPPPDFLAEIEKFCRQHEILLVCDEVKFGLGRTGLLHAFEHSGIEPDIVVFGKGLGGGLPMSAIVGPQPIMNHSPTFSYQTLHGNPACAAAALAVLETIERDGLVKRSAEVGSYMMESLSSRVGGLSLVGEVRGKGLAIGIELVSDRVNRAPAKLQTALTVYRAFQLGLVLYYVGANSNVLELTPPLTLSKGEADDGIAIISQALQDVIDGKVTKELVSQFAGW
ncbi:MAG: aspartate aminotransferase family protein [Mesorhizobium sp.]|uniref:aspartate aminotransferase family protein n=1 Tax=Mesorhizobium sp. TaxID=1871066 RepID=UPI000FE47C63|nr:aspartate aminotransferase family protein [Mesorhizobium sp.]RWE19812.1 MAG: aspartate aminotransferase family protein [Mesorhizobium sp.]